MSEIQNELPRIKDGENPDHLAHAQINAAFTPLNTTEAFAAANKFTEIENKWTDGVRVFAARIQRSSSAAWDGPAAEAARSALSNYTARAQDLSPVLQALGSRVYGAVDSINSTKRELPDVVEKGRTWTPTLMPSIGAIARTVRDDAEATARSVMGTHYVKPFVKADSEIPVLPKPDDPTQPLVPPVKPPTEDRDWEGGGGDTGGDDGGGDGPGRGDQGGTEGEQGGTEGKAEETTGTGETGGETTEGQQDPTTTTADALSPSNTPARLTDPSLTSTTPAGVNTAGYSPTGVEGSRAGRSAGAGGLGRGSGAGSGDGSGGSGSAGSGSGGEKPGAGRSIAGSGGIAAPTGTGANAAAKGAATGRGMMGVPMGGMGAGRGGNAEEHEHKTPDYLITAENTDELLGEVPKTVAGGVIGGDVPSAAPVREPDGEDRH